MTGYIHSKESFGTVDGPGIRYVLFMQGCPMRCLYCHNPDTWEMGKGEEITVDEVIAEFNKNRAFYSKGGITVTGGEPLLQTDFLIEILKKCKENGIHTAVDTAGYVPFENFEKILPYTDLFLYDIKLFDSEKHKKYTGMSNKLILENLKKRKAQYILIDKKYEIDIEL